MTLAQKAEVTGIIVVSTPQDVALRDARKALNMFDKLHVKVLGMIENMSTYICPTCGSEAHIFGHGGARADAERLGLPFLGEIPLTLGLRETSDAGTPIVVARPDSAEAAAFRSLARQMIDGGYV
jgi:ATP-binding protein involved in chromosome partitioning